MVTSFRAISCSAPSVAAARSRRLISLCAAEFARPPATTPGSQSGPTAPLDLLDRLADRLQGHPPTEFPLSAHTRQIAPQQLTLDPRHEFPGADGHRFLQRLRPLGIHPVRPHAARFHPIRVNQETAPRVHPLQQFQQMLPIPIVRKSIPPLDATPENVIPTFRLLPP